MSATSSAPAAPMCGGCARCSFNSPECSTAVGISFSLPAMRMGCRHLHILRSPVAGLAPATHVFKRGSINGREGVDARAKPTAVRFRLFLQLYEDAVYDCTTVGPPWPDLFRPPTSSDVALSPARKAWMAGPCPATGIVGCA